VGDPSKNLIVAKPSILLRYRPSPSEHQFSNETKTHRTSALAEVDSSLPIAYDGIMPRSAEEIIHFRRLYQSQVVTLRDYRCLAPRGGPDADEYSDANKIVLMRHGAFCKHFGRRGTVADVNHAVFFSKGSTYRVSHPGNCGDRGTVIMPAPAVLDDIVRQFDPSVDDEPGRPFPFVTGPCETRVFWRHRELVQQLESADTQPPEPIWADVTALQLVADVVQAAFAHHGHSRRKRRQATNADHAERVEAAKVYLAARLGESIALDDVARWVHTSPFHLSRVFHQRTGVPIHRYLTRLRLRASLERLADGAEDITALALDLGFSSHSHFTGAFRTEFGQTPSEVRRSTGPRALRQMGKNLEV
jgi:AraC family transcriptional regulator